MAKAKQTTKKKIKITNRGMFQTSRGICRTPITRPYLESIEFIFRMIAKGAKIVEVLENGEEVELTEQNFNLDNSKKVVKKEEVKKPEAPKAEPAKVVTPAPQKQEAPKQEQPKKEEPKKPEAPKVEPVKEEPKKEEPKKPEVKPQQPAPQKQEEPKKEEKPVAIPEDAIEN